MENMILMGSIVDDALEAIQTGLLWVCLCLDNAVYSLVNFVYQIILVLARVNVFEDTSVIDNFVNRVYIIIGVVALFLLAYSLLKALINPDEGLKGKNSPQKVIANVLISIALIAFTPTIFSVAMGFQNSLLEQGTLTGIIVGSSGAEESAQTISDGGFNLAAGVFQAFFHPNSDYCQYFINSIPGEENINLTGSGCTELEVLNGTYTYSEFWESMSAENSFNRLPELNKDILGKIDYTWLLSTAVGIFVVIVLVIYCIDIAIRAIKLAAYQLIAPIPILARLLPGEQGSKVFSNWVKACISTYLEVFIRLGILFFVVLIIAALQRNIGGLFSTFQTDAGFGIGFLAWAFLIVGLIFFIKDFPNVIKEITGLDSGKYGKSLMQGFGMMTASLGGGATAAIRRTVADNREHPEMGRGKRALRTLGALGSGMKSGLWQGRKTEKPGDIPKNAGRAASTAINRATQIDALGGGLKGRAAYYQQKGENLATDFENWKTGGFDAKQRMLDEVNKFRKDADDIKETSEGFVRKKKYLFSLFDNDKAGQEGKKYTTSDGEEFIINHNTSLSEAERIITTLNATGKVSDAHIADEINNLLQRRIKKIGQKSVGVAIDRSAANVQDFNSNYMVSGFDIEKEATPMLDDAQAKYVVVQRKFTQNPNLDAVIEFKNKYTDLQPDNVSKLSDELGSQSSKIAQDIRLEQERRKNSSNGSGGNNH